MMLSTFNVNKLTTWFKNNHVEYTMYKCIFDILNKNMDMSNITNKTLKNYMIYLSQNLPDPFFKFSYGVDEILLTVCLQSQLPISLDIGKINYAIDYIFKCELYVINISHQYSFDHNTFISMGIKFSNNGIMYDPDILIRLCGFYYLAGSFSKNAFRTNDPNKYISPIYEDGYDNYLYTINKNKYEYKYDDFLRYIDGSLHVNDIHEEQLNVFKGYLKYIENKYNYKVNISEINKCFSYVETDGKSLKNISSKIYYGNKGEFSMYMINNVFNTIFPAHLYKSKLGNLEKEQIIKSSKYYLGKEFINENDINKYFENHKENPFSELDANKKIVNFYKKYIKYKSKYLSFKYLLSNNNF